ncbi:hypothetical protein KIN20_035944 [Parelaphostrongylus tenuis]|uniref:SCP domain-containing protein n=1 Tax=Parelaphostrongylus tenuis TaxID=148309 RepID=A0AAD5RBW7_PARTN|nr:hypothetical protein KIN20_035944 [Parelaphostrongylus tenuis]
MARPDIQSVGCGVAKCPESNGTVNASVACFYGKIDDEDESDLSQTCEGTDDELKAYLLGQHERKMKLKLMREEGISRIGCSMDSCSESSDTQTIALVCFYTNR